MALDISCENNEVEIVKDIEYVMRLVTLQKGEPLKVCRGWVKRVGRK
jgi:hypothetical protein